jgi:hypothetical protein
MCPLFTVQIKHLGALSELLVSEMLAAMMGLSTCWPLNASFVVHISLMQIVKENASLVF